MLNHVYCDEDVSLELLGVNSPQNGYKSGSLVCRVCIACAALDVSLKWKLLAESGADYSEMDSFSSQ